MLSTLWGYVSSQTACVHKFAVLEIYVARNLQEKHRNWPQCHFLQSHNAGLLSWSAALLVYLVYSAHVLMFLASHKSPESKTAKSSWSRRQIEQSLFTFWSACTFAMCIPMYSSRVYPRKSSSHLFAQMITPFTSTKWMAHAAFSRNSRRSSIAGCRDWNVDMGQAWVPD